MGEWAQLLVQAASREVTADGVRYSFVAAATLEARIRALAAAEHDCCSFLELAVSRVDDRIELTATAPAEAQEALRFVFAS
jgi:hypothetical protein